VAQIARTVCRALRLDEDLAEAVALAHDLGHTPFGHTGEDALDEMMRPFGGFDHNAHALRILTVLERRYVGFDGLNLTWETLEGMVKHNGPLLPRPDGAPLPEPIAAYNALQDLALDTWPSAEAQVAAMSDDVAYNNHDLDDGLRAGLITIRDLDDVPLVGPMFRAVADQHPGIEEARLIHESIRRLIDHMVRDLLEETRSRLADSGVRTVDDVRGAKRPLVGFSEAMRENDRQLKAFLFERMYRHYKVNRVRSKARRIVRDLFRLFLDEPECLPTEWQAVAGAPGDARTARVVADYIAGMTDRFALDDHHRLFDTDAAH
jgi:dGTPase